MRQGLNLFVNFISNWYLFLDVEFIDGDGNIIIPKAVRPIIDLKETALGSKKGANKQYRYGNLHIRDYDTHYSVHTDTLDPSSNALGHLLVDAPEYLAGATAAFIVGRRLGATVYGLRKKQGKTHQRCRHRCGYWLDASPALQQATLYSTWPAR